MKMKEEIKYLRILLTNKCNLDCFYCHKEGRDNNYEDITLNQDEVILFSKMAYDIGFRKFKLMGGEPTLYKNLESIIEGIRSFSDNIDISMVTNGILLKEKYVDYLNSGIDRFNISIHGWNLDSFTKTTGGSKRNLLKVKENIDELSKHGYISKINFLVLKGENETEMLELISWIGERRLKVDLLNILYESNNIEELKRLHYSFEDIEIMIRENFDIEKMEYKANMYSLSSKLIYLKNGAVINLKTSRLSDNPPFYSCKNCSEKSNCIEGIKAIRLTEKGDIKPCLLREDNYFNLREEYLVNGYKNTVKKFKKYLNEL